MALSPERRLENYKFQRGSDTAVLTKAQARRIRKKTNHNTPENLERRRILGQFLAGVAAAVRQDNKAIRAVAAMPSDVRRRLLLTIMRSRGEKQ